MVVYNFKPHTQEVETKFEVSLKIMASHLDR